MATRKLQPASVLETQKPPIIAVQSVRVHSPLLTSGTQQAQDVNKGVEKGNPLPVEQQKRRPFIANVARGSVNKGDDLVLPKLTSSVEEQPPFSTPFLTVPTGTPLELHEFDYVGPGRELSFADVIDVLTYVFENRGDWPDDPIIKPAMRRYYRRKYPEFFTSAVDQRAAEERAQKQRKAAQLRTENRPSRAKIKKKKTTTFDAEIDATFNIEHGDVKSGGQGGRGAVEEGASANVKSGVKKGVRRSGVITVDFHGRKRAHG